MHSTSSRRLFAALCTVLAAVSSVPALHTWTGADGGNPTAWGSAGNWSAASVPGSGDDVAFGATAIGTVDLGGVERSANTVTFGHASGTYVLTNGTLRCTSTASNAVAVTGNGTVQAPATLGMTGDAFGIRKAGSGTWTLQAANAFGGGITIADGTLTVAKRGGQGSGTITFGVANKTLRWAGEPHVVQNPITFASSFYGAMYFEADTALTGPISLPNASSSVKFYPTAIGRILGSLSAPATGGCILEVRNGTKELVVYDPSSVTEPSGVNARIQVTSGGAMLAVRDVNKLFSGHLLINNGVLLLDGVSWSQFLANRSGGYGADTGAGCRKWQFGDSSGFAARTSDLVIGDPGEDLSYLFDRSFRLSSSILETNGLRYADADVIIRGDVVLSGTNRTITIGASGPGVDPIAPQHSFAVIAGTLSGSGVAPVFVSSRTGSQYQNNQVGEMVLRGTNMWTGGFTGNFWNSYWFSSGAGGLLNANTNTVNYHSLVRFDGNASLPRGNAGQPAHLAAFLNQSGGASLCHGFLLTAKPGGETYELPTGYRFVLGGMGNRSTQNVLGASSHDGVSGTATLQNSDICHHGLPASVLDGDAAFSELGLLVRDGTWVLGTDAGGPARFIPVWSLDAAPSAAATALNDDLRMHTLLKRGQGTLALANAAYTTLDHAGSTRTNFVWTIGRASATANSGANSYFDGAVRGRSTFADDSSATLANSLFASGGSFALRLRGGVYEVDANGVAERTFSATVGSGAGNVGWGAGGGGFSAFGGNLRVDLNGASQEWNATDFLGENQPLMFGSYTVNGDVVWNDALGLMNGWNFTKTREIRVIARTVEFPAGIHDRGNAAWGGTGQRTLLKTGAGTLRLSASSNNYAGPTTVEAGTLQVDGTLPFASVATGQNVDPAVNLTVTVQSGARLAGTGNVRRNVSLQSGGILAPGASVGTLTLTNATLEANAAYAWEFTSDAAGGADKAIVTGDLTFTGPWTVRLAQLGAAAPGLASYTLFDVNGTISGFDPAQVTVDAGATAWGSVYEVVAKNGDIIIRAKGGATTLLIIR